MKQHEGRQAEVGQALMMMMRRTVAFSCGQVQMMEAGAEWQEHRGKGERVRTVRAQKAAEV